MELSLEAKKEINSKLELAKESDDLVFEIEAMREENVKHFYLGDGSFQAVAYGDAVHRKDVTGKWQDIDNSLVLQTVKNTKRYSVQNSRVTFADTFSPLSNILTLSENGYSVSFSLKSKEKTTNSLAKVSNHKARNLQIEQNNKVSKIDSLRNINNTSSIKYENIQNSVDLEYVLTSNTIKENIIIKEPLKNYSFTFVLEVERLVAKLTDSGVINLHDSESGDIVYVIPAPYMFDAKNEVSYNVSYTLNEPISGKYELTITADEKWINSEKREFPVTIDPVIAKPSFLYDTYVSSSSPQSSYGLASSMWVSSNQTSLIRIEMPTLPVCVTIQDAKLYAAYYYSVTNDKFTRVGVYKMTGTWYEREETITYSMLEKDYGPTLGISSTLITSCDVYANGASTTNPGWAVFPLTSLVDSWITSGLPNGTNHGVALKRINVTNSNSSVIFKTYEAEVPYRAYFSVTYREPQLPNGIYRIRNDGNSTSDRPMYMDTTGFASGATVTQQTDKPIGSTNQRDQLFKITYLTMALPDNNRYYSIRSMRNSALVLSAPTSGTTRYATFVGDYYDDTGTNGLWYKPNMAEITWKIEVASDSFDHKYTIKNNGGTSSIGYLTAPSNKTAGERLTTSTVENRYSRWYLERYTGSDIHGHTFYTFPSPMEVGDIYRFSSFMYSSVIGRNGPVKYSVANSDGSATDKATINQTTGLLSAKKTGEIRVCATYDGSPLIWFVRVTIVPANSTVLSIYGLDGNANRANNLISNIQYETVKNANYNFNSMSNALCLPPSEEQLKLKIDL